MSTEKIEQFYQAFARLDGEAMTAFYAPDAWFEDEAFSLRGRVEVGGMWQMLCAAVKAKGKDVWKLDYSGIRSEHGKVLAHWEPVYRFSATGRMVHNIIDAEFEFRDGLIVGHRDRFDFNRWAKQALGPMPVLLLGWTPLLRNKVRNTARANLNKFLAQQPS
ncbi:ketosteroid isomerase [Ahniella affigens]|uniref:Ketosteroid isomerase n=1 Tax=Ahniella affigens TaxID=2021234 RepID=A0A2P1PNE4_9GAMM|nr:nuclear transport factor 2 family protein [Ahniella affigens]AVP96356.1 ketosteroid isomerase [Ahniella affigens]